MIITIHNHKRPTHYSLTFNIYLSLRNYDDETFSKTAIVRIGNYLLLIQFTTVVAKCQHLKWLLWFEECYYDWSNEPAVKALDNKVLEILLLRFHFSLELLEGRAQVLLLEGGEGQQRPPGGPAVVASPVHGQLEPRHAELLGHRGVGPDQPVLAEKNILDGA